MKHVAVLSSAETPQNLKILHDLTNELSARLEGEISVGAYAYDDVAWYLDGDTPKVVHLPLGAVISTADYVWFKSFIRNEERAIALAHLFQAAHTPFECSELLAPVSTGKLTQYAKLRAGTFPIPPTAFVPMKHLVDQFSSLQQRFGEKLIIKAADGKGGEDNYCITTLTEATDIATKHAGEDFVIQAFIPNKEDFRVLVFGGEIKLVIRRSRVDQSTHLNNTSQGASAELVPIDSLSAEEQKLCIAVAEHLGREIAGVDLMRHAEHATPYILEVNAGPQLGSGAFTEEKLAIMTDYLQQKVLQNKHN